MRRLCTVSLLLAAGCSNDPFSGQERTLLSGLVGPAALAPNSSNKYADSAAAAIFGQKLFFDTGLSGNSTLVDALGRPVSHGRSAKGEATKISCATCHDPLQGGADLSSQPNHVSIGTGWGATNALSVLDAARYELVFWNGRTDSLWGMVLPVYESGVVMNGNRLNGAWEINERYKAEYQAAFPGDPLPFPEARAAVAARIDPTSMSGECRRAGAACPSECRELLVATSTLCLPQFPLAGKPGQPSWDRMSMEDRGAVNKVMINASKAIEAYERKLITGPSPFDRYMRGEGELDDAAIRGARLFAGKAACIDCHRGPNFSDGLFHNIGVAQIGISVPTEADCPAESPACDCVSGKNCLPWGQFDGLARLQLMSAKTFRRDGPNSDDPTDASRSRFYSMELDDSMKGAWRTPSLRNVSKTAPYMHNGSIATLEDVVAHYDRGGAGGPQPEQKSERLVPLGLTAEERADLVAFLKALDGDLPDPVLLQALP